MKDKQKGCYYVNKLKFDGISLNFQNQLMNSVRLVVAWQTWLMTGIPNLISNCTRLAITLIIFFIRSLTGKIYHHRPPRGHLKQWDTHYVITSVVIHTNNCSIKSPILDTLLQRSKTSGISIPTSSARWGGIYTHAVDFASFIFSFQPNTVVKTQYWNYWSTHVALPSTDSEVVDYRAMTTNWLLLVLRAAV